MMIYPWKNGAILPDPTLEATLGLQDIEDIGAWIDDHYPTPLLDAGKDYYSFHIKGYVAQSGESALIDLNISDRCLLIWCEHWGDLLACYHWLLTLAEREYRLNHATETDEYLDDLSEESLISPKLEAHRRLLAGGYTVEQVERMEQHYRARRRTEAQQRRDARTTS